MARGDQVDEERDLTEFESGERSSAAAEDHPGDDGATSNGGAAGTHGVGRGGPPKGTTSTSTSTSTDDAVAPLVTGDPLLSGSVPVVRHSSARPAAESSEPAWRSDDRQRDVAKPRDDASDGASQPATAAPSAPPVGANDSATRPVVPPPPGASSSPSSGFPASTPTPPPPPSTATGTDPSPEAGMSRRSRRGARSAARTEAAAAVASAAPAAGTPAAGVTARATAPLARTSPAGPATGGRPGAAGAPPASRDPAEARPRSGVAPAPRTVGRRPRVRRVTRVVRHVDPWSVFKVAAVFSAIAYLIALIAGVLLWNVAYATGTVDNIERGLESTGWSAFQLEGGSIFHNAWIAGLFLAVGLTGIAVVVATLFNLITDLVGGVRFTVLEEEVIEKAPTMRRFSGRRNQAPQDSSATRPRR